MIPTYVALEHEVEVLVLRKGVAVALIGAQFGTGCLLDAVRRNRGRQADRLGPRVPPSRKLPDKGLGNVLDGCISAYGIAIDRRVAHSEFALVAGGEHEVPLGIGQGHERGSSHPCLEVLLGKT